MSSLPAQYKATLLGLLAILLWSSVVGLIRSVSEGLGPIGGAAMIYSVSAVFLLLALRMPNLRLFPRPYLLLGSLLFVSYEICLALSLGYANTRLQAIEVGMINYLWPCFTVVMALALNGQKAKWWLLPGLLLSLFGIGGQKFLIINGVVDHRDFIGGNAEIIDDFLFNHFGVADNCFQLWSGIHRPFCTHHVTVVAVGEQPFAAPFRQQARALQ